MSLRCCDPKRYHHLTNFQLALCLYCYSAGEAEAQTSVDSLREEDITSVCTACMGEHMVRWKDGAQPSGEYISGGCTSSITSLPERHMPQGSRVQALCPHSLPPTFFPSQIMGDEEPWVCRDDLKGQPGDDIKLCCFCFLSQLSWLVPLFASKPTAASPVVSIQALKLFKLFAERCSPSVSSSHAWATPVKVQPQ